VPVREVTVAGFDALMLASELLQRARCDDVSAGLWEAADVQWWWSRPQRSDDIEKLFWVDDDGPLAGVLLTSWADVWQCDPVVVHGVAGPGRDVVWACALEQAAQHSAGTFDIPVRDDDHVFRELARRAGLVAGERDSTAWMNAGDRPDVQALPGGFVLTDRTERRDASHPMRRRNGDSVAERLGQCSLYDPALDLAVETFDGRVAGYSLYWFDPTTKVGLVEPVRVEEEFYRLGLARAMLTAGIDRLVERGAERVKVSYESDTAGALYQGIGFRRKSTATWYRAVP
jgi:ribosomal protein S18 acetylase RimI-like enzyme